MSGKNPSNWDSLNFFDKNSKCKEAYILLSGQYAITKTGKGVKDHAGQRSLLALDPV